MVARLRDAGQTSVSLVAIENQHLVGHVLFSPMTLDARPETAVAGLAPLAVLPEVQNRGIGTRLVREGLTHCRQQGFVGVFVLGHPSYYPRFGFQTADRMGFTATFPDAPPEAFMVLELVPAALRGIGGIARYHPILS